MIIHPNVGLVSVAFFFALSLAVAPSNQLAAQTKPKTIFVGHGVDLESLNPYWHNTTANYAVWRHFLEPLAEYESYNGCKSSTETPRTNVRAI